MHRLFDILKTNFDIKGAFSRTQATQQIGAIEKEFSCALLSGTDDCICFQCPEASADTVWVLELDELHNKEGQPFSYKILVNDTPVYLRTMEPVSSTLCPCFVKLKLQPGDFITICNNADRPVCFADIFLHSDLKAIEEIYQEPMEIGLCFPRFTYTDREADLALMEKIRDDFSDMTHFTIAIGVEIKYMLQNDANLREQFQYILGLAAQAQVNLIFNFNTWWDGTPDGRDGKGGYFGDMEYQQVVYDPLTGKKLLSIPNIWGNTPWYTMNHEHLNRVRKERLACTLDILGDERARLQLREDRTPNVRLFIDNEPTYWAEFAYTASPESGGDFNEHCIAAAAKDGVDLEPRGDLTHEQKEWLVHNLCTYMTDISRAYQTHTAKEYATVRDGSTAYTNHYLAENTFTHIMSYSKYPYADGGHLHYEEHVNPWTRLGVESNGFQDERVLSYINATGRYAQVNAERCCYNTSDFHQQFYAHGAVCDIIFNYYYDTDKEQLHALDNLQDLTMPEPVYGTPVMSWRGYDETITGGTIIEMQNMTVAPLRERRVLRPATLGRGSITFTIGQCSDYPHGGWVELTGLIRPDNGKLRLSLGTAPDSFPVVMDLPENDVDYLEIPMQIPLAKVLESCSHESAADSNPRGDQTLILRLDFENLFYDDWAQMNGIWKIRSVAAFPGLREKETPGSSPSAVLPLKLLEARALALMVSYRTDCRRLAEQASLRYTADSSGERGVSSINYKALYNHLMHEISVAHTDRFLICGQGYLEKYGLHVDSGNTPVSLILEQCADGLLATLSGVPGSRLEIRAEEQVLQVKQFANCFKISRGRGGACPNFVALTIPEEASAPHHYIGTFLGYDREKQQIKVTTHDTASWHWQAFMHFSCNADVPVSMVPSPLAGNMLEHISTNPYTPAAIKNARIEEAPTVFSLQPGDGIQLTISGNTVTDIQAVRGIARGRIVDIVPVSMSAPMHNAFLTIETAPGIQATFELGMKTHLNYKRAHAENPLLAGELDLELKKNCIVLISFEPETIKENCYRALEVTLM